MSMDQKIAPLIEKLIEYGKNKKVITIDEINDMLPPEITNSDNMDEVFALLEKNSIQIIEVEEDEILKDEDADLSMTDENYKKKLVNSDKDASNVDDPIRFYLKDIGKEHLLTAEQEVELSKKWKSVKTL